METDKHKDLSLCEDISEKKEEGEETEKGGGESDGEGIEKVVVVGGGVVGGLVKNEEEKRKRKFMIMQEGKSPEEAEAELFPQDLIALLRSENEVFFLFFSFFFGGCEFFTFSIPSKKKRYFEIA